MPLTAAAASATVATELSGAQAEELLRSVWLPPCPAILTSLLQEARRDEVDTGRVVSLIAADAALSAAMLKAANSPYFALRTKAQGVAQAVAVLGMRNLVSIITGIALRSSLTPPGVNLERFWDRSSMAAVAAAGIARLTRTVDRELAYTFGLFHDCGIPVLMMRFPEYRSTVVGADGSALGFIEYERERHHTDHAVVGAMVARNWQLPTDVVQAIALHHDFEAVFNDSTGTVPATVRALVAVVHLADSYVARSLGVRDELEWAVNGPRYLAYFGLDETENTELFDEVNEQLGALRGEQP